MAIGLGLGMHGMMQDATMGITVDKASVPAGKITFEVKNASADTEHEMIVAPVSGPDTPLAYNEAESRVDEDAAGSLGEVEELEPGESGSLSLTLTPGTYILYCNIASHYQAGMWTILTVTAE